MVRCGDLDVSGYSTYLFYLPGLGWSRLFFSVIITIIVLHIFSIIITITFITNFFNYNYKYNLLLTLTYRYNFNFFSIIITITGVYFHVLFNDRIGYPPSPLLAKKIKIYSILNQVQPAVGYSRRVNSFFVYFHFVVSFYLRFKNN